MSRDVLDLIDAALDDLHARNVAEVSARLAAAGRCIMHNSDVTIPARYLLELPIGNVLPLCADCHAWWLAGAIETGDPMAQPVHVSRMHSEYHRRTRHRRTR